MPLQEMNRWEKTAFNEAFCLEMPNGDPAKNHHHTLIRAVDIVSLQQGIDMEGLVLRVLGPTDERKSL
jgi:hypothetical protein